MMILRKESSHACAQKKVEGGHFQERGEGGENQTARVAGSQGGCSPNGSEDVRVAHCKVLQVELGRLTR